LNLHDCVAGAKNGNLNDPNVVAAAKFVSNLDGIPLPANLGSEASSSSSSGANNAAAAPAAAAPAAAAPTSAATTGSLTVFESCTSDSQCQQGCCAFSTGKCAGPDVAQTNGDGGCGFGDAAPNCNVASALKLDACVAGAKNGDITSPQIQAAAQFVSQLDGLPFTPSK
jgi:hypothetical protein